jgi:RNA polymerase sigma factor (sigma-70 family)
MGIVATGDKTAETAGSRMRAGAGGGAIGRLLDHWQATGVPEHLEALVVAVRPMVESVAVRVLRSRHIVDRSAVDDVVSLVFDHLRRLPRGRGGERPVALFRGDEPGIDRGTSFIRLLARNRSLDVARSHRRHRHHECPFSAVSDEMRWSLASRDDAARQEAEMDVHDRLAAAIDRLEPDLQAVVQMLLDDKSQAVIAHVLGVCEGTVSRVRGRAVAKLRELMDC